MSQYSRTRVCYSFGLPRTMHPGPNARAPSTRWSKLDGAALAAVALATTLFCFIAYRPAQLYFFGDTWDILAEFHERGWVTMWRMHNEHFMPVSKALLYFQYVLFRMNNLPYQAVDIALHSCNAALLYILAGDVTPFMVPRIFGALFFAFSGVYWETTMWEAGQQTTLALLFMLLSLVLCGGYLRKPAAGLLAFTVLSALLASWSMGFGLLVVPLLALQALAFAASQAPGRRAWKRVMLICALPAAAVLVGFAAATFVNRQGIAAAARETTLHNVVWMIPWTVAALRGMAASYRSPVCAPLLLGGISLLVGLFFRRYFLSKDRLLALLMPVAMLLLPHALAAVGRAQSGTAFAASSRYQYLPAAALGLILAWLAGGIFSIVESRYPKILQPLAVLFLLTLPWHAIAGYEYVGRYSQSLGRGRAAHRFVSLAIDAPHGPLAPPGMACVRPELYLPPGMYPLRFFDLTRALPLYAGNRDLGDRCTVAIASVLGNPDLAHMNLLPGGARERELRGLSAYGFETHCAGGSHPYTFAASVRLVSGEPGACMRIVFKGASGNILDVFPSRPIESHDFGPMAVSAYPDPDTATVAVDFAASAPASQSSVIAVKDAALVEHPVYLPASLLQKEVPDKHRIDSR